jgi:hypothetical protein
VFIWCRNGLIKSYLLIHRWIHKHLTGIIIISSFLALKHTKNHAYSHVRVPTISNIDDKRFENCWMQREMDRRASWMPNTRKRWTPHVLATNCANIFQFSQLKWKYFVSRERELRKHKLLFHTRREISKDEKLEIEYFLRNFLAHFPPTM